MIHSNFRRITLLFVVMLINASNAREVLDSTTQSLINCYVRHLKNLKEIESTFLELQTRNTITDCELSIKNVKTEMFKAVKTKMNKSKKTARHADCVADYLKLENWFEIQIKQAVYEASSLSEQVKKTRIDQLKSVSDYESEMAIKYCLHQEELGILYDDFYDTQGDTVDDKVTAFCTRKYVIDNGFSQINLAVDQSANVSVGTCDDIINTFIRDIENSLIEDLKQEKPNVTKEQVECTLQKYKNGNYTQKFIETAVVARIHLNNNEKSAHKRSFIKFVSTVIFEVMKCFSTESE